MFIDKTRNRKENDNIDYNSSLSAIVWKDAYGVWHISQATSEETLIEEFIVSNKAKGGDYKLFCGSEYEKALEYKKEMQGKEKRIVSNELLY